jgi:hypothetical protein
VSVVLDSRAHATAVKAAIKAQLGPNNAYDYDEVPGTNGNAGILPNIYVLVTVQRRFNGNRRLTAQAGLTGWRISARAVGRTIDEVRWAMFKVATALNEERLTISGSTTTPIQFETDQAPESDDGRFSGLALYTYAH